jgi:hypothetical protein
LRTSARLPSDPTRAPRWAWLCVVAIVGQLAIACAPAHAGLFGSSDPLDGKVFVGYQGWFAPRDELGLPLWRHLGKQRQFEPGFCGIDLWPDTSEFTPAERVPTAFRHADGSVANVFSSDNAATIDRHFLWMKQYGVDGAFLQRFPGDLRRMAPHMNRVLANVRNAAERHGRSWCLMYDLTGLKAGEIRSILMEDFRGLVRAGDPRLDRAYLRTRRKPLVVVWGVGFSDGRSYTLDECRELIAFLKSDPECGGNAVMLGVPYFWRELRRDAVADPALHDLMGAADVISPWAIGRLSTPEEAKARESSVLTPDVAWARERGKAYLPVVFPGYSFHNSSGRIKPLDQIPRQGGKFLWSQAVAAKRAGAKSTYIAMFDEIDEGTAIFKTTADVPVGETKFVTEPGVPSDQYLWLSGQIGRLFRGEIEPTDEMPTRQP